MEFLRKSKCERDLGIYMQSDFKWGTQVKNTTAKENRILSLIKKALKYTYSEAIKLFFY